MLKKTFEGMKSGKEEAFNSFVKEYANQIFAYALTVLRNRETAQEVTQKTLINVVDKIHQLRDVDKFEPWLFRMTYRMCLDELKRKENKYEVIMDDFLLENYGEEMKNMDENSEVWAALEELPENSRTIIVGKYIYELTEKELASMMKIPTGTVKSRLHTARKELKGILEKRNISPTTLAAVISPSMIPWVMENFKPTTAIVAGTGLSSAEMAKRFAKKKAQRVVVQSAVATATLTAAVAAAIILTRPTPTPEEIVIPPVIVDKKEEPKKEVPITQEPKEEIEDNVVVESCKINEVAYEESFVNTSLALEAGVSCGRVNRFTINGVETQRVDNNGTYTLAIWDGDIHLDEQTVSISNIDKSAPKVMSQSFDEDTDIYTLRVEDDISGLYESIEFYENGKLSNNVSYSPSTGEIVFLFDRDVVYDFIVKDNAGNYLSFTIKEQ